MDRVLPRTVTLAATAALVTLLAVALAVPAVAHGDHGDHGHSHSHGFDDADFLDPVIWDGTATVDCRAAGEGTIVWTLTGSDGVEYAELHIDEPEATVTARTGGPYVWISPLYPLDEVEADADRIVGTLAEGARLEAVTCPEGGVADGIAADATDAAGLLLPVGGGVLAGGALGLLVGARRRSA